MEMAMLTPERLSEVSWALGKIKDAEKAVEKLLDGEAIEQPPPERRVVMTEITQELDRLHERLEQLYS